MHPCYLLGRPYRYPLYLQNFRKFITLAQLSGNGLDSDVDLGEILASLTSVHEIQLHANRIPKLSEGLFTQNCNLKGTAITF